MITTPFNVMLRATCLSSTMVSHQNRLHLYVSDLSNASGLKRTTFTASFIGSLVSAVEMLGLSTLPCRTGPVVVRARSDMLGRATSVVDLGIVDSSASAGDIPELVVEGIVPFSPPAADLVRACLLNIAVTPSEATRSMVCMSMFCLRGFDRYSSICACIHFSRSPNMACAVSAMIGVRDRP